MAYTVMPADQLAYTRQYLTACDLIRGYRHAGTVVSPKVLQLHRHNIVALKNGAGCALLFVRPENPPAANVELLSLYLKAFDMMRREGCDVPGVENVPDCAALAAHYLLECDWFGLHDAQPCLLESWILLANNLRRVICGFSASHKAQATVCERALLHLTHRICAECDFATLPAWACAALARVLTQHAGQRDNRAELTRLARRISSGAVRLATFGAEHLASLLESLGKVCYLPDCKHALAKVAGHCTVPATARHWQAISVVKGVAGFLQDRRCMRALNRAALFIVRKSPHLEEFSIKDACDIARVLRCATGQRSCINALKKLALYLAAQPAQLEQLPAETLGWIVNAISIPDAGAAASINANAVAAEQAGARDKAMLAAIVAHGDRLAFDASTFSGRARTGLLAAMQANPALSSTGACAALACEIICQAPLAYLPLDQLAIMVSLTGRWAAAPEPARCRTMLADHLLMRDLMNPADAFALPVLLDGLLHRPADPVCEQVVHILAPQLASPAADLWFLPRRALVLLVAFMGKRPGYAAYQPLMLRVGGLLMAADVQDALFHPGHLPALSLAMAAWRTLPLCRHALTRLATQCAQGMPDPAHYDARTITALLQAFAQCAGDEECARAAGRLVAFMRSPGFDGRVLTSARRITNWRAINGYPAVPSTDGGEAGSESPTAGLWQQFG